MIFECLIVHRTSRMVAAASSCRTSRGHPVHPRYPVHPAHPVHQACLEQLPWAGGMHLASKSSHCRHTCCQHHSLLTCRGGVLHSFSNKHGSTGAGAGGGSCCCAASSSETYRQEMTATCALHIKCPSIRWHCCHTKHLRTPS